MSAGGQRRTQAGSGRGRCLGRQDQSALRKDPCHAAETDQRICGRRRLVSGTAGDCPEVERDDRDSRVVGDADLARLHRHHRRDGYSAGHCAGDPGSGRRLRPVGQGQPTLADSIQDCFEAFQADLDQTPHKFDELVEKDHGRLEVRRCSAFDQLEYLHAQDRWPDLRSSAVIASERTVKGKATLEHRFYISSLSANATRLARAVRQHGRVENGLH